MTRTLIEHLDYVLTVDAEDRILRDAFIVIADGRIESLGTGDDPTASFDRSDRKSVV